MSKSLDLKQTRASLIAQTKQIIDQCEKENRDFSQEEESKFQEWTQTAEKLQEQIKVAERREWVNAAELDNTRVERKIKPLVSNTREQTANLNEAYSTWFRFGHTKITDQQRENAALCGLDLTSRDLNIGIQKRTATVGVNKAEMSDWVPTDFYNQVQDKLLDFGSIFPLATKLPTSTGNALYIPLSDDTANKATIIEEEGTYTDSDPTATKTSIPVFKYMSVVSASREMLEDNQFPLESYLVSSLGTRMSRGIETDFATGDGSTVGPEGIIPGSTIGVNSTSLTYNMLVDLYASIDPLYLNGPNVGFMMATKTWAGIMKLTDASSNGRPLVWSLGENLGSGIVGRIFGFPVYINNSFPDYTLASGSGTGDADKPIVFGNFSYYWVRTVGNIYFQRLSELRAKSGIIDFLIDYRVGGKIVSAGAPLKHWRVHS